MSPGRSDQRPEADYTLLNEELLEFSGQQGVRSVCHLLWYGSGSGPLVCIAGNFDGPAFVPTTNAIEVVATRVAERVRRDASVDRVVPARR